MIIENNNSITVDVIIPNYNKFSYLEKSILSVINQTYEKWILYIIDDNSTDKSHQVIDKFKNNKKINIIKLKKNMGPSFCRNLGIRNSKSPYISFLDSDDYWTNDKLELQLSFMIKNNFNFTYTDYISIYENIKKDNFETKTNLKDSFKFNEFILNSSINTSTVIIKKNVLNNIKYKNVKLLEDYLFKCEILRKGIMAKKFNKSLAFYRINNKNRSRDKLANLICLWKINKNYNNLSFFKNLKSLIMISLNSLKKYGLNKYRAS